MCAKDFWEVMWDEDKTNLPGLDGLVSSSEFTNLADNSAVLRELKWKENWN